MPWVWTGLCCALSSDISTVLGLPPLPLPWVASLCPSRYSTHQPGPSGSQRTCPNFLSPKLISVCSHSCSCPPGLSHRRDFLHPSPGLHCPPFPLLDPSPPSSPSFVLIPSITRETHSSGPRPPAARRSPFPSAGMPPHPHPGTQAGCLPGTPGLTQHMPGTKPPASSSSFLHLSLLGERTLDREQEHWAGLSRTFQMVGRKGSHQCVLVGVACTLTSKTLFTHCEWE